MMILAIWGVLAVPIGILVLFWWLLGGPTISLYGGFALTVGGFVAVLASVLWGLYAALARGLRHQGPPNSDHR